MLVNDAGISILRVRTPNSVHNFKVFFPLKLLFCSFTCIIVQHIGLALCCQSRICQLLILNENRMEDGTRSASRLFNISDIHAIELWEEQRDNDCCYLTTSH